MDRNRGWYNMERQQRQTYEERFLRAYERLERPLVRVLMLCFVLIVAGQAVLMWPAGRQLLSGVDQLEGQKTNGATLTAATKDERAQLTIRSVDSYAGLPKVWVKVNGIPVSVFSGESVTVSVRDKDVVTVDTSGLPGVFRFEVDHDDPQISYPVPGMLVEANDGQEAQVGPVHFSK
jgi:hypothetical protein